MNFFGIFGKHAKPMKPGDFTSPEAKAATAWIETVNPLRGMMAQRMQNLYDASRSGDTVHLQWLYQEIEKVDPTLLVCQQRRTRSHALLIRQLLTGRRSFKIQRCALSRASA